MVLRVWMVIPPILTGKTNNRMSLNHVGFGIIRSEMKLPEPGAGKSLDHPDSKRGLNLHGPVRSRKLIIVALLFFTALGVRILNWQSYHNQALAVQTSVADNYKHLAGLIRANGLASLYDPSSSTSNPD